MKRILAVLFTLLIGLSVYVHAGYKPKARRVETDTTNFGVNISTNANTIQKALDELDDVVVSSATYSFTASTATYADDSDKLDGQHWSEIHEVIVDTAAYSNISSVAKYSDVSNYSFDSDTLDGFHYDAFVSTITGVISGSLTVGTTIFSNVIQATGSDWLKLSPGTCGAVAITDSGGVEKFTYEDYYGILHAYTDIDASGYNLSISTITFSDGTIMISTSTFGGGASTFLDLTDTPSSFDTGKYFKSWTSSGTWEGISGDNLGNHTATQDIDASGYKLSISTITATGTGTFGDLVVDTDTLYVDKVNHRVGIGTTSPNYKLDVTGTAASDMISTEMGFDLNCVVTDPGTGWSVALIEDDGNLGIGRYRYTTEYVTALGESGWCDHYHQITTDATHKQVEVTLPISSDHRVTGRKIFRTPVDGATWEAKLLTTINDNTTTTYIDNIADGDLGSETITFSPNTTSMGITKNGTTAIMIDDLLTILGAGGAGNFGTATAARAIYIGSRAGKSITSGSDNTIIGHQAGQSLTTQVGNTLVGTYAGGIGTFANSVAIGQAAGYGCGGERNVFAGRHAGSDMVLGTQTNVYYNVGMGYDALKNIQNGAYRNTAIGYRAGYNASAGISGNNNTLIGAQAGDIIVTGHDNIIIGYNADPPASDSANFLNIGDTIYGDLSSGKIGIGTTGPNSKLEVNGTIDATAYKVGGTAGWTGTFYTLIGSTVTVTNGLITNVE